MLARRIAENIPDNNTKITNRILSTISSKKPYTTNKSVLRFKKLNSLPVSQGDSI